MTTYGRVGSYALWQRITERMLVSDRVRKCVVFIGALTNRGQFVPQGTGFIVGVEVATIGFGCIVTAKHVIDAIGTPTVAIRMNLKNGKATIFKTKKSDWLSHPGQQRGGKQADVAIYSLMDMGGEWDNTDFAVVLEEEIATPKRMEQFAIGIGDEIAITGLFVSHWGDEKNIPILRIGNIACMPEEPILTNDGYMTGYLVETRSLGGLSGSPAFVHLGSIG